MTLTRQTVNAALQSIMLPNGANLGDSDMVRALTVEGSTVRFVLEAPSAEAAAALEPLRAEAERTVGNLDGVEAVSVILTAHSAPKADKAPPSLKVGRHPTPDKGPEKLVGIKNIIAIGSGKGGVGKSTVTSNIAIALARAGRRVGLLDADIYGPSQPRMMGVSKRAGSPDGKIIIPNEAHGIKIMSMGFMMEEGKAVVWRGPMLMGALQQMMTQVAWGELDVLLIDLPPGTGDVQLTLAQRFEVTGAIIVSTPQDVALLDARKAINMFGTLNTPILGMIENMSTYICPNCGHEAHLFGHGGVVKEAEALGVPLLATLPLDLDTRLAADHGRPIALGQSSAADAYTRLADRLIKGEIA
ncbi:MAG: Mrp/NBP35 family ATP-binding protein [Pseudomonadota bacterium]